MKADIVKASVIIDDLFLDRAYRSFFRFYEPIYGGRVKDPLDTGRLIEAIMRMSGGRKHGNEFDAHVFYLPERPSRFTSRYALELRSKIDPQAPEEMPIDRTDLPELLGGSIAAVFHEASLVAMAASEFAIRSPVFPIVMADDPAYALLDQCPAMIFIRLGNEETRMPPQVNWINSAHVFCEAYGVDS